MKKTFGQKAAANGQTLDNRVNRVTNFGGNNLYFKLSMSQN